MSGLKVLVVGASIAGPATAYWLAKAGAHVTVIERFPSLRAGGQAVDLRTVGVSVMRRMTGMEAAVREKWTGEEGVSFVREDGRPYGVFRSSGDPDRQSLVSEYEIFRGDLSKVLYDLAKDKRNVKYVFNEHIEMIRQHEKGEGPVKVHFANGSPPCEFDLVVACDGATSRTRAMAFACDVRQHIVPSSQYAAYFSTTEDLVERDGIGRGYSAPGGRALTIGADREGGSRIMLMSVNKSSQGGPMAEFREAQAAGTDALKAHIADRFRDVGWKSEEAIQVMTKAPDFYASEIVQVKLPAHHIGRVVLVGDAGYAAGFTGGGTSLALAGAFLLAGELSAHSSDDRCDIPAALAAYEQRMAPLIKELQKEPPQFVQSILAPQTAYGIWLRNNLFGLLAWSGIVAFMQKWLGGAFADTNDFPLPEYDWNN
jgi:2-polyprenyl-6-methoxyphenol hydroxylase-like FAD-dependent oxidoreductase